MNKRPQKPPLLFASWADEAVLVELRVSLEDWSEILAGKPKTVEGVGYHYEGEFFQDSWEFEGGLSGDVIIHYGDDGGVGWNGPLHNLILEEE